MVTTGGALIRKILAGPSGLCRRLLSSPRLRHEKIRIWRAWWRYQHRMLRREQRLLPGNRALRQAALDGNEHNVAIFLQRGADPNLKTDYDWPLMVRAAGKGYTEICRLLLDAGAAIDAATPSTHHTALMRAATGGHSRAVALLLERGADMTRTTISQIDVLLQATLAGHTEVVRLLLQQSARHGIPLMRGRTALAIARKKGFAEIVELLLQAGVKEEVTLLRPAYAPCAPPGLRHGTTEPHGRPDPATSR